MDGRRRCSKGHIMHSSRHDSRHMEVDDQRNPPIIMIQQIRQARHALCLSDTPAPQRQRIFSNLGHSHISTALKAALGSRCSACSISPYGLVDDLDRASPRASIGRKFVISRMTNVTLCVIHVRVLCSRTTQVYNQTLQEIENARVE